LLKPGYTFYSSLNDHLWIVLTEPNSDDKVICVSFTTKREHSDCTTECDAKDHEFLKHATVIAYRFAILIPVKKFEECLATGAFDPREQCGSKLLKRILEGLLDSDFTPNLVKDAYRRMRPKAR
jgi:hypothetical protein